MLFITLLNKVEPLFCITMNITSIKGAFMTAYDSNLALEVCGGCNAKIGSLKLHEILASLPKQNADPKLLLGFESADDACIYEIDEENVLIQTLDFFPTPVAEPYYFGQIAATNALSDIYAMGATPAFALNIVAFPSDEDTTVLKEILRGGQDKVKEAGCVIAGGHSIHDAKAKYGLVVTGFAKKSDLKLNNQIKQPAKLYLSKPLGAGILCGARSVGELSDTDYAVLIEGMTTLNKQASFLAIKHNCLALTDVTGFGLIGHLKEMLSSANEATIYTRSLPLYPSALAKAKELLVTGGGQRNRQAFHHLCSFRHDNTPYNELLFDPQTSGGLLIAMPTDAKQNEAFIEECQKLGVAMHLVGEISQKTSASAKQINIL